MSKSLWSGNRPKNDNEAKLRLCEAALECINRNGLEKATMSDIAREAGVARPTLYKHYKSKYEIFLAAIDTLALQFTETVVDHARQYSSFESRVAETIIYVAIELPKHKYFSLILDNDSAAVLRGRAFSDEATLIFLKMAAEPLLEIRPDLVDQGMEITEIMSYFAISLTFFPGRYTNDREALRALIERRILPGLI